MIEHILETIHLERIDDLPLLLAQLQRMRVIPLLDQYFPTHGNWAGELTFGEVAAVWLAAIVSTGDHRLNRLEDWAATRLEVLAACLGKRVRALDFHDDRLADMLDTLQDPIAWTAFEQDLNAGLVRVYRDRPARVEVLRETRVVVQVNEEAVAAAMRQCGWRVYATNHPELTLEQAVLSYRGQYGIEHGFARLKGKALGLSPMYVQAESRVEGLVQLLSIGLRVLTLVEYEVRRSLAACGEKLRGVFPGQRGRGTSRPSAELLLEAFRGLDLRVMEANGVRYRTISPLTAVQRRILQLLEVPSHVYEGLAGSFSGCG